MAKSKKKKYNARAPDATYLWTISPSDVSDDGYYDFGGAKQSIVGVELRPPPPDDANMVPVISMRKATDLFEYCPSCGGTVPHARPIFAAADYMVYPCLSCEWVWCDGTAPQEGLQ